MYATHSPLRYPGGKAAIIGRLINILKSNDMLLCSYAEPFAGGCGLALGLLMRGYVSKIYINDIDKCIWAFWHSVLQRNRDFLAKMEQAPITMEEWHAQRDIVRNHEKFTDTADGLLALGFATFFLNRTNRSGIICAGVIGGLQQAGAYKLDCRFNKKDLAHRIRRIGLYKDQITLSNLEALEFLDKTEKLDETLLYCIDPPYYKKGATLYTKFYKHDDHAVLAQKIAALQKPWILTYDNEPEIAALYAAFRSQEFSLNYSAQNKCKGAELMFFSDTISNLPPLLLPGQTAIKAAAR